MTEPELPELPEILDVTRYARVVFFTGAGMSAESGVPTYRGEGGLWEQYKPEEYACQEAFERDPEHVWDFHDKRRKLTGACSPHEGHELIARYQQLNPSAVIVTQNIDGMHQQAGATGVYELHGSLWRVRCDSCGVLEDNRQEALDPRTHSCGGYWRPDIVWFGDMLRMDVIRGASEAIAGCDLLISIGTSAVVYPAAELPHLARRAGATLVEVNPEETQLSDLYDACLRAPASVALRALLTPALG
jgi:NAD-dependent deacetylase